MRDFKLCLLLLLGTCALAQQDTDNQESPECLLATKYKNFKKYVYRYEAETKNGVSGTADLRNGPKVSCKVELEAAQTCSYVLTTSECVLSEVTTVDAQGKAEYRQTSNSEAFKLAMERQPLRFVVEHEQVTLYPDADEPTNILNVKRGIISALIVPTKPNEERMPTVHGLCRSDLTTSSTEVTVSRDLSECDQFSPMSDYTSPLALISRMNLPLSKLISSKQTCFYQFDGKNKHMTAATCTENHVFLPFSHEHKYGILSEVVQTLTLLNTNTINSRYMDLDNTNPRALHMDFAEDKAPVQTKDKALSRLRALAELSTTKDGNKRGNLFQKLVSEIRALKNETLSAAIPDMLKVSSSLTWQALAQCGTPECISAVLQSLRTLHVTAGADAVVYALGLLPKPCHRRVREMLSMAQYRQSKPIMYGLSNSVRKYYQSHPEIIPEITEVAEFVNSLLSGDCTGDEETTFLTLRVVGNMGEAMQAASPTLKSTLLQCVNQPGTSPSVQQAAIQAFRQMSIDEEVSQVLLQVYQDRSSSVQKRVAAYLMMMKNPETADLAQVVGTLQAEQDEQVKSFVASHISNIIKSQDSESEKTRLRILEALQGNEVPTTMDSAKFSRNYKMASAEGNVIFDSSGYMPKEVLLDISLKAFGFHMDMFEVGMEGNGFEPSIDALFGDNGFFPDTTSKAMYWAKGNAVAKATEFFQSLKNDRMKRQVPQDIIREVGLNFNKLVTELKSHKSPEFMAYLRLMGNELGYIKSSDIEALAHNAAMYSDVFLKIMPMTIVKSLLSSTDNELFAHYIFMDNQFALPTSSGFPLKFSLSGIFAPGAKGGLNISPRMQELSFMPSLAVEFVTHMGIHIPEFIMAGVKMHTTVYHENAFNAKLTMGNNQVKFSILPPKDTIKLFTISNKLLSISSLQTNIIPSLMKGRSNLVSCDNLFPGMRYCTMQFFTNAGSTDAVPYFPLTGDTLFAVEVSPTNDVTEYSGTLVYELLKEGRQRVDMVKMILMAEGKQPAQAMATVKYNRNKNILTTDVLIPDYDVEVGVKLAASESTSKGKKMYTVAFDVTNKNIPQLSLSARTRLEGMKDGMVQLQLVIPSLQTDATATASLKAANGVMLTLETAFKVPETSSFQKVILRYDEDKLEVEMKSDINSEIQKLLPDTEDYQRKLQKFLDDILDHKVAKTDMKLRHIVYKTFEAGNIWLDKIAADFPYVNNMRNKRNIPELTLPSIPEKLFLKYESLLRYQFNKDRLVITVLVPWGGKSSDDLNMPTILHIPSINIPQLGLHTLENAVHVPSFTIPETYDLTLPLMGVAQASAKISSNFYNWEGSISGGNDTVETTSFIAKFKVAADSPVNILSYEAQGTAMVTATVTEAKYSVNSSFKHSLLDASFSGLETVTITEKISGRDTYKFELSSPLGLQTSLFYDSEVVSDYSTSNMFINVDGRTRIGAVYAAADYSCNVDSNQEEIKGESTLKLDSTFFEALNKIKGAYANDQLSIVSDTKINNDALKHVAELSFKNGLLSLTSDVVSPVLGPTIRNKAEITISGEAANARIETEADDGKIRGYSLLIGSLNSRGMEANSEGSLTFNLNRGSHKATLTLGTHGLATSGMTTLQSKLLTMEKTFSGSIDSSGATMSVKFKGNTKQNNAEMNIDGKVGSEEAYLNSIFKGNLHDVNSRNVMNMKVNGQGLTFSNNLMGSLRDMKTEHTNTLSVTLWTLSFRSKTDNFICDSTSYKHDIHLDIKPFITSVSLNNDLKVLDVEVNNEGLLKLEPYKMDLSGGLRGAYGEDQELRHTYKFNYDSLVAKLESSSTGKICGATMSHNVDLEVAGLSSKLNTDVRFNSKSLRVDGTFRTLAIPFSLNVDGLLNADGDLNLHGTHKGQLYSKFLLKAEPLALAYSHDCRASTEHTLNSGSSTLTHIDNKIDGQLVPTEQSFTWRVKSKLNNNAYNQEISAYNNAEKTGIELSGTLLTNVFKRAELRARRSDETEEFSISGFLKYDKNGNTHVIQLPFIESAPVVFEQLKSALVTILETLQQFLNGADIKQLASQFSTQLNNLPQEFNIYLNEMDLESKIRKAKEQLSALSEKYFITLEDLEASLENMKITLENTLHDLARKIMDFITRVKKNIDNGTWPKAVTDILMNLGEELRAIDERNQITKTIVNVISLVEDILKQIDLQKLKDSGTAWLLELDSEYEIKATVQEILSELKKRIEDIDIMLIIQDMKNFITTFDVREYFDEVFIHIPTTEIVVVADHVKDVILNWIEEYEIADKLNTAYSKVREILLTYEIDKKIITLMEHVLELMKQYKIKETTQMMVDTLNKIDFQHLSTLFMEQLDKAIIQLKAIDLKQMVHEWNEIITRIIKEIKEFDYNAFVTEANRKISEMTDHVNQQIQAYEIPQKIEASRKFIRSILASVMNYLEQLKDTKVAKLVSSIQDVFDTAVLNDIKLKIKENLDDLTQRIYDMDIRKEILHYLQRLSESYTNIINYIRAQFKTVIEEIRMVAKNPETINQIEQMVEDTLKKLKTAHIEIPSFILPLTDLVVPAIKIDFQSLQDISIPQKISIPEFTILDMFIVPSTTIDIEDIKQAILVFIQSIRDMEFSLPRPEDVFGDLRLTYLSDLPDLTFPEITLSEIKFPEFVIPRLNLDGFNITMLQLPEVKFPRIPSEVEIPAFGKLYGEFKVNSPYYKLKTETAVQNSTTSARNPEFTATLTSKAESTFDFLEYTLDATARIAAPKMKILVLSETLKLNHRAFEIDHLSSITLNAKSPKVTAKTTVKATTEMYTAAFVNNMLMVLESGISSSLETSYTHNLNIPEPEFSSQVTINQKTNAKMASGSILLTVVTTGNGKWSVLDYADDGTHNSNLEFSINMDTAKLTFSGDTTSQTLKMKQNLSAESVIFSHVTVTGQMDTETPFSKTSVKLLKANALVEDLRTELVASHSTELFGSVSGTFINSVDFLIRPFEIVFNCKNKGNSKIVHPMKIVLKIDLQNDYGLNVKPGTQEAIWVSLARFNQYKYYHSLSVNNNENDFGIYGGMNGEANLDFLTLPISVPAMNIPFTSMKTPKIKEVSVWEVAGLDKLLKTTQQSFDMNFKLQYQKNPDMHAFDFDLEPIYNSINENAKLLNSRFDKVRTRGVAFMTDSYNQAKSQFEKYKIESSNLAPKSLTIPGYTIPVLNIEVSPFTTELPTLSFIIPKEVSTPSFKVPVIGFTVPSYTAVLPALELPVIHVPKAFKKLTLPKITLPAMSNTIWIPAMGNITSDFSFKSSVMTINANAGLYNQSDIVAKFEATSASRFDVLKVKLDGTTRITRKRGLKLANALSLDHVSVQGHHDSTLSLTKKNMEATLTTSAKVNLPVLNLNFSQELRGNTKSKPNVASKMKAKYIFSFPKAYTVAKGGLEHNLALEGLISDISMETSTKANFDVRVMENNLAGNLDNEANVFLNANGLRSTVKSEANSLVNYMKTNVWSLSINENLAMEASLQRVYATLMVTGNNEVNVASYNSKGKYSTKAAFEFVPLTTLTASLDIDVSQPSDIMDVNLLQNINLVINDEKQKMSWSGKNQLGSAAYAYDLLLSNDENEIRLEVSKSLEGHVAFLKGVKLPIYQKTLWDILKFDLATSEDKLQFLNASYIMLYTKNKDGFYIALPTKVFPEGVTFTFPEVTLEVPSWMKNIPEYIREIDTRFETSLPEKVSIPPVITIPAFKVPFTTLLIPSVTIDVKNIEIPKVISTPGFQINLPGMPTLTIPSINIDTTYLKNKLSVKVPQYELTISSFTLPKSFTIGKNTVHLDQLANKIYNFEMPTITIPEQKIDVPEISLHLPAGIFIPKFGTLSTTVKISSPIYNSTWSTELENRKSSVVSSLKASCSSTMVFLEYDLDATLTSRFERGALSLTGKGTLLHSDLNLDWQQALTQNFRMKRQVPQESSSSFHTLNINATSTTFADVSFRYASRKDGISSSISSTSSGFLGFTLQRRSPSQVMAKLYSRYLSDREKDVDILTLKLTLRNPEKLNVQVTWNPQAPYDMLGGVKDRVPAITSSLYKLANKYHTAHFGMDLNRASLEMKKAVSNSVEKASQGIPKTFVIVKNGLEQVKEQGKTIYKRAVDNIPAVELEKVTNQFLDNTRNILLQYQKNVKILFDAVIRFLSESKFQLPGFQEKLTGQQLVQKASKSIAMITDRIVERMKMFVDSYTDALLSHIKSIEFTIPGTNQIVSGKKMLENFKSGVNNMHTQISKMVRTLEKVKIDELVEKVRVFLQMVLRKAEQAVASLKTYNMEDLSAQMNGIYTKVQNCEVLQDIIGKIEVAEKATADYKDVAKQKIKDAYQVNTQYLNVELQSWIEAVQAQVKSIIDRLTQLLQDASLSVQPYVRVSNRKLDIDIPLPRY